MLDCFGPARIVQATLKILSILFDFKLEIKAFSIFLIFTRSGWVLHFLATVIYHHILVPFNLYGIRGICYKLDIDRYTRQNLDHQNPLILAQYVHEATLISMTSCRLRSISSDSISNLKLRSPSKL